jgi:hypothetical protein
VLLVTASPAAVLAQDALPWASAEGRPNVKIVPAGKLAKGPVVEVTGKDGEKTSTTVLVLEKPKVPSHQYMLRGRIKYEGVKGPGYIEMLNTFPGRGTFFTRTLGDAGTLQKLDGSSDWRDLELPFMSEKDLLPSKITVSVVLPGKGTVWLAPLTVGKFTPPPQEEAMVPAPAPTAPPNGWWDERQAGGVGAILGCGVGLLGTFVGLLAGAGVGRRLAVGLSVVGVAIGGVGIAAGVTALALGQPDHVYFPLLLVGAIAALVFGLNLPGLKRRYDQIELRRMAALDA